MEGCEVGARVEPGGEKGEPFISADAPPVATVPAGLEIGGVTAPDLVPLPLEPVPLPGSEVVEANKFDSEAEAEAEVEALFRRLLEGRSECE